MSSTERAPEPTMEEILSSIRRIITDDEADQAQAQNATHKAQAEDESLEGEADNQIIDDIARVLSGDAEKAPAGEEEEIFDLAAELGGLEIIEEGAQVTEVLELDEVTVAETPAEPQAEAVVFVASEVEKTAPEPAVATSQPPEAAPPAPPVEPAQAAGQEAASALERAIAALRAGQTPGSRTPQPEPFAFQTAPQADTTPAAAEPEPIPMAVPMASPEVEAETHPEPAASMEPAGTLNFEAQPEIASAIVPMGKEMVDEEPAAEVAEELILTDAELTVTEEEIVAEPETEEKAPFWPVQEEAQVEAEAPASEAAPVFEPGPVFEPEAAQAPEPVAAQVNGGTDHDVAGKTLEDSVKDMLRPMLREWLDENMPRLIREGFDPETLRRRQD